MKYLWTVVIGIMFCGSAFGATYEVSIDDRYVPYLEKRAVEEKMSVQGIIENLATSIGRRAVQIEYQNEIANKKNADVMLSELTELKAKKPKEVIE